MCETTVLGKLLWCDQMCETTRYKQVHDAYEARLWKSTHPLYGLFSTQKFKEEELNQGKLCWLTLNPNPKS